MTTHWKRFTALFMIFILILSASAYKTALASPIDQTNTNAKSTQVKTIVVFAKTFGWDLTDLTFYKKASDQLSNKHSWDSKISTFSKNIGLKGEKGNIELIYAQKVYLDSTTRVPYTVEFRFWMNKLTDKLSGAYIAIIPYGVDGYDEERALLRSLTDRQPTVSTVMQSYYQTNILHSSDNMSTQNFPIAYRITNKDANAALQNVFSKYGFHTASFEFGYALPTPNNLSNPSGSSTNFLKTNDLEKALFVATNGKGKGLKIDASNLVFAQQSYVVPGSKNKFYVNFCLANQKGAIFTYTTMTAFAKSDKIYPEYSFLMVQPAKKNSSGAFDRFFYPPDTSLQTISTDMYAYFQGKTIIGNSRSTYPL